MRQSFTLLSVIAMTAATECPARPDYDAIVVGNGPCGLTLASALTGKLWPYYVAGSHPDTATDIFLRDLLGEDGDLISSFASPRIKATNPFKVIDGISTRSDNPLAAFYDALRHPMVDSSHIGYPSCLQFREGRRKLRVLVVGKGAAGGSWHGMPPSMLCLSPGSWMGLPGSDIDIMWRPTREEVASSYAAYPDRLGLPIRENATVRRAARVNGWWEVEVEGDTRPLTTSALVLATGMYDEPKRLGVPGEELSHVTHRQPAFGRGGVLVVIGAGLSAADCVVAQLQHRDVIHIYRKTPDVSPLDKFATAQHSYPEYFDLYQRMLRNAGDSQRTPYGHRYTPYTRHEVLRINHGSVDVRDHEGNVHSITGIDEVAVLIGSVPDLGFLPQEVQVHIQGMVTYVEGRKYRLEVDPMTMRVPGVPGLYACGPLRGDNFVRFVLGDSVGVTADILSTVQEA